MKVKEYYSYQQIKEILKKIALEEFDERIKCSRCKRFFDPDEEIIYFVSRKGDEVEEAKGFFVCFECRDELKNVKVEQLI